MEVHQVGQGIPQMPAGVALNGAGPGMNPLGSIPIGIGMMPAGVQAMPQQPLPGMPAGHPLPPGMPPGQANQAGAGPAPSALPASVPDYQTHLNTYIYDYLLRTEQWELARLWVKNLNVATAPANGEQKGKRPADLPEPSIGSHCSESSFLLDWWCQFWEVFAANRSGNGIAAHYLKHTIAFSKNRQESQAKMQKTGAPVNMAAAMMFNSIPNQMMRPGMEMGMPQNGVQQRRAVAGMPNRMPPQHMQHQPQNGMRRDASAMEMSVQHSQTPGPSDTPSSPKRPRLDSGPGPGPGPGQQNPNMAHQRPGLVPGPGMMPGPGQGGPMMISMNGGVVPVNPAGIRGMNQTSANALQDYQQQLMLLEQQNKKRLMKAKQEHDGAPQSTGPIGLSNYVSAPAMSPSGSRAAPSPNPDQLKRATSGLNQAGSPIPAAGQRPTGSPANFDGQVPSFMDKNMSQSGPGQMNARPPSAMSNPPLTMQPGMNNGDVSGPNPSQMSGSWTPAPVALQNAQQMGTPQQRASVTTSMGPPPAPVSSDPHRLHSSSPSQVGPPPTPSQAGRAAPKPKKETRKKAAPKRSASNATAPPEMEPPTPTTLVQQNQNQPQNQPQNPNQPQNNNNNNNNNNSQFNPTMVSLSEPPMSGAHVAVPQMPDLPEHDPSFLLDTGFDGLEGINDGSMANYDDIFNVGFPSGSFNLDSPHFN